MKRVAAIALAVLLIVIPTSADSSALSVGAEAAVLLCADNGTTYFSKNEYKHMRPASTTKIMTALLTLEYAADNNKKVRFKESMTAEGSSMYLEIGEVLTLKDLAVGILMCSGNDAANAAAISIAGSKKKFAALMNERARKIGMRNTHFVTPSGLDDDNHYSCAYDMALLMTEALKNPDFAQLTAKRSESVTFVMPENKTVTYTNHNRLLSMYGGCIGGKTGYTMAAGRCLVTAARRDGITLVAVTLNDRRDWDDHTALYDYGFENYRLKSLDDSDFYLKVDTVGGQSDSTVAGCQACDTVVVHKEDYNSIKRKIFLENFIYAPVKANEQLGVIQYSLNGKIFAEHKLIAMTDNS